MPLAAILSKFGEDTFEVREVSKPTPQKGEVLVNIKVRPVNPADYFSILGVYPAFQPKSFPATPGLEGMGVIEALGEGVTDFKVGQRVAGVFRVPRSFQEYVCLTREDVIPIPDDISDEAACQIFVNPYTVWGLLTQLGLKKGQYLVQSGASSEVGRMVIQVAAEIYGIKTINLVRRAAHEAELKALGADHVIVTGEGVDVAKKIKEIVPEGAHGAIDCVAGDITIQIQNGLAPGASLIIYGAMAGMQATVSVAHHLFYNQKVEGFWVSNMMKSKSYEESKAIYNEVLKYMRLKDFAQHFGQKFALKDVKEAMKASQAPSKPGKVLLYNQL